MGVYGQYEQIDLGPAPCDEDCVQVTHNSAYLPAMKQEVNRFRELLMRKFINRPDNTTFELVRNDHDFGPYYTVAARFDANDIAGWAFALYCEGHTPQRWDDDAPVAWDASNSDPDNLAPPADLPEDTRVELFQDLVTTGQIMTMPREVMAECQTLVDAGLVHL